MTVSGFDWPETTPSTSCTAVTTSPATSGLTATIVLLGVVTVAEPWAVPLTETVIFAP